jgi:hypothetical protein
MPHLIGREYFEIIPGPGQDTGIMPSNKLADHWNEYDTWFAPEYIVEGTNPYMNNTPLAGFWFGSAVNDSELGTYGSVYQVYERNGSATLLVRGAR